MTGAHELAEYAALFRPTGLIYLGVVRAIIRISLTVTLTCCSGAMATAAEDLYRAQAIVTGQGEANRIVGFASCLEDVLIKVSGAQKLAGDRRLAAYKSDAKGFVRAFSYHDQMSCTPIRDDEGPGIGFGRGPAGWGSRVGGAIGLGRSGTRMGHTVADGLAGPDAPMAGSRRYF